MRLRDKKIQKSLIQSLLCTITCHTNAIKLYKPENVL